MTATRVSSSTARVAACLAAEKARRRLELGTQNEDMERVPFADGKVHQRLALEPGFLEGAKLGFGMHDLEKLGPP